MREILSEIAASTAQSIGNEFLASLVRSMREAMNVSAVLITTGIDDPPTRVRSMASWQENGIAEPAEYDLEGTPCQLVYNGETLIVSEGLYKRFETEPGYEGYVGIPLRGSSGKVKGHLAVLSHQPFADISTATAIAVIFAQRVEAEIQRLDHERERESLIADLSRVNRRLANRHAALRESNETKTILLSMVAHDLRNPLGTILSRGEFIEELAERGGSNILRIKESCDIIMNSVERMDRLIESVLSQARTDATAIKVDIQSFPAARAMAAAIALNAVAARKKSISISRFVDEHLVIRGDEDRIVEALDNYLSNAIKYSHPGQKVRVSAAREENSIRLSVEDEGQGLNPEDCRRAFRQYQRLSSVPTAGEPSSGLGLAIVKAIAEAHGGSVDVSSPGKDKGATFSLVLPHETA